MKILLSFIDPYKDFHDEHSLRIHNQGIHAEFYATLIAEYDQHILLSEGLQNRPDTTDEDELILWRKFRALRDYLELEIKEKQLTHELQFVHLNNESQTSLMNDLISLIHDLYDQHPGATLQAYITPGTDISRSLWHMVKSKVSLDLIDIPPRNEQKDRTIDQLRTYKASTHDSSRDNTQQQANLFKNNEHILRVYDRAARIASAHDNIGIVIMGETGTGKEELAKHIYKHSVRKFTSRELMAINCSGFTDELLRSELFGHVKGAFTGATHTKEGFFQKANNGILFLDEIGDISKFMQSALLRVLQSGEIQKVGSTVTERVNVQIIYATNANLIEKVKAKEFREDLYHRMFGAAIETVPFRHFSREERIEVFEHFLIEESKKIISFRDGKRDRERKYLTDDALEALLLYDFPGNFRELHGLIESLYVTTEGRYITRDDLPHLFNHEKTLEEYELEYIKAENIKAYYERLGKNIEATAKLMKISENTVRKYIE